VPATGFYEWKAVGKKKFPTAFRLRSGLRASARLWERWNDTLETFTILTTSANEVVGKVHDRMPVTAAAGRVYPQPAAFSRRPASIATSPKKRRQS
jgi:putative SOS response-associated peptidase YedK